MLIKTENFWPWTQRWRSQC